MLNSGTRKLTPALDRARAIAAHYPESVRVSKREAVMAAMRVAAALGLSAGAQTLLNALFAASSPLDWTEDGGSSPPIVWPSNERLCQQIGATLPTVKRYVRSLVEAGLIVPRDSPNGKRWGRRDDEGRISVGYGFDLSPIAVRHQELLALAARLEAQRGRIAELRREATIRRRRIDMALEAAREHGLDVEWEQYADNLRLTLARYPRGSDPSDLKSELRRLDGLTIELGILDGLVEDAYREATQPSSDARDSTPKESVSEPHLLTTKQFEPSDICRSASGALKATEKKDGASGSAKQRAGRVAPSVDGISIELVAAACPEILSYVSGPIATWRDLLDLAAKVRPWIGISEDAWDKARSALGDETAAAALAVTFEKHAAAKVTSPGGYLRGIVDASERGELRLARTLYGLASAKREGQRWFRSPS